LAWSRLASFGVALGLLGVLGCDQIERAVASGEPAAEADERIEILVPGLVDAIQAKQPVFVMDHVSTAFKEERGLDYYGVRSLVESFAFRDEEVGARLESVAITPAENGQQRVAARVSFALGQRLAENTPLPPGAVTYSLDLLFARDGARWQAVGGSYRRE
jgi:hypothetical protein